MFSSIRNSLPLAFILLSQLFPNAHANIAESYGFGSVHSGLAGSSTAAWGFDSYSAYNNPAALAARSQGPRLILGASALAMIPKFNAIDGITTTNTYIADSNNSGNVTQDYKGAIGQSLGLSLRLFPNLLNLSLGLTAFLPLEQTAYMDTGETFVPEYFLYRSRLQRPQIDFGLGVKLPGPLDAFHLGIGLHLGFAIEGSAVVYMTTDTSKVSTMRFATALKPKAAPVFSLLYAPKEEDSFITGGLVVRLPVDSSVSMILRSAARAIPNVPALDLNFLASSSIFYDPLTVEFGGSIQEGRHFRTHLQLEFQNWHAYKVPALLVQDPTNVGCSNPACGLRIADGWIPAYPFRNIWVPRIGQEFLWNDLTARAGYAYRASILPTPVTGAGNYIDPSKHIITFGAGYHFRNVAQSKIDVKVDAHFAYHALIKQDVTKTPGNERDTGTDSKVGAPGYTIGGSIYGGGMGVQLLW